MDLSDLTSVELEVGARSLTPNVGRLFQIEHAHAAVQRGTPGIAVQLRSSSTRARSGKSFPLKTTLCTLLHTSTRMQESLFSALTSNANLIVCHAKIRSRLSARRDALPLFISNTLSSAANGRLADLIQHILYTVTRHCQTEPISRKTL
jgi:hypothetical protein